MQLLYFFKEIHFKENKDIFRNYRKVHEDDPRAAFANSLLQKNLGGGCVFWWYPEESNLDSGRRKHQKSSSHKVSVAENPSVCLHHIPKVRHFQKTNVSVFSRALRHTFQTTQHTPHSQGKEASWTISNTQYQQGNPNLPL